MLPQAENKNRKWRRVRVIPSLLLRGGKLVKTRAFAKPRYIGDPINAVKIFNEKEVDEIAVIDISANGPDDGPDFEHIREIAGEAFMPLAYGGRIRTHDHAERAFSSGAEKVILNTAALQSPEFVTSLANRFGSQSVVVSLDVRRRWLHGPRVFVSRGRRSTGMPPVRAARLMEEAGAGELIFHDVNREGTYRGFDLDLLRSVTDNVRIPVVALGGARDLADLARAVHIGGASAVAAGSIFVFQGPHRAVLITYPNQVDMDRAFSAQHSL